MISQINIEMIVKNVMLAFLLTIFIVQNGYTQLDTTMISQDVTSPWLAPVITDDMTKDPEQNRLWRLGQHKYPAQPKHMWELGLHAGNFFIDGDIDHKVLAGLGMGIHIRKALTYFTSIRFEGFYGTTKGLERQPWRHRSFGGGLVESGPDFTGWEAYDGSNPDAAEWFPSYKTKYYYGAVQLVFNIGNLLWHQERNKWNTYVGLGVGLDHHTAMLDLQDAQGAYTNLRDRTQFSRDRFDTKAGRDEISRTLEEIYDGVYETEGFKKTGIFRIGDDFNIHAVFTGSVGFARKVSRRLNIGLEHQVMASDNDYLDGIKFRTSTDQSNNVDIAHYTNLRLAINMGNFKKRVEPLYWINPMENVFGEIAELKSRPQFEWIDEDNDGVLDLIDQELDTPEGCLVDTKGVTLDSDGDTVVDCRDKEPFSPPGYPVDADGVAQIDDETLPILTEQDVITIIQNNCDACQNSSIGYYEGSTGGTVLGSEQTATGTGTGTEEGTTQTSNPSTGTTNPSTGGTAPISGGTSGVSGGSTPGTIGRIIHTGCGNWFLPMINFDLDKYSLRPEAYVSLHQIASVMRKCPNLQVTAHGHTDVRNSNNYNRVLSYNRAKEAVDYLVSAYGIEPSRFNIMYGGEESPLIHNLKDNHFTDDLEEQMQFINRRVEFRVSEGTDFNMARPEGRNAGSRTPGPSRPGSKYKGNKNSGY